MSERAVCPARTEETEGTLLPATTTQPCVDVRSYLALRRPLAFHNDSAAELALYVTLPGDVAEETAALEKACEFVRLTVRARSKVAPACEGALRLFWRSAARWGWKMKTFRALYDRWARSQDWVDLVNRSKANAAWRAGQALPPAFIAHVLAQERGLTKVLADLRRQWRTGRNAAGENQPVPGYETLPDGRPWEGRNREVIPNGWHRSNVGRQCRPEAPRALPAAFLEFWRMLCELHQRVTSNARRQLLGIWRAAAPFEIGGVTYDLIPGYTAWPEADPRTGVPAGWTDANLNRHTPDEYELAAARIGIQKAGSLGFKIRTSRLGLRLGEFMEFDDHEFNVKVNFPGQLRALRPRCFGAVDALTDCMFSMVIKPTFWDMEAEMKRTLTERDFMWFIVAVLTHRGYRADVGTMLLVEWGTSAIRGNQKLRINDPLRDDFEKRIWDATSGKVRVDRGGRFHKAANPGQFAPPTGGNFRFKPHVEQFWRMLDDWLDALKGQTGKSRDFAPEEMERADAYNNRLLKTARSLGVEQASRLVLPRMTFAEFSQTAAAVMNLINDDPDHACNSWEECGFVLKEWRAAPTLAWEPLALLAREPAGTQLEVERDDLLFRARRMTRAEADRKHAGDLTPLPMMLIPRLVGPEFAGEPVTVRGGRFEFRDRQQFCTPDPLAFLAVDAQGQPLAEGEKFTPYCNPLSPDALVICDASGAVVSVCPPDLQPARNDDAGVKRAMGVKNHWQAVKLSRQRARHAAAGAGVEFMKEHNTQVLSGTAPEDRRAKDQETEDARIAREALSNLNS